MSERKIRVLAEKELEKMISQGNTAEVYDFGEGKVLKLFRSGMPIQAIEEEFDKGYQIQAYYEEMPRVFEMVQYENRYGIVYEKIVGRDLLGIIIKNPRRAKHYAQELAAVHVNMHQCRVEMSYPVKEKLAGEINRTKELTREEKEAIIEKLQTLPDGDKLCHFDYHPGNLMMQENKPVVIDWMTACVGEPAADVARTYVMLQFGQLPHAGKLTQLIIHLFEHSIWKQYFMQYKKLTGMTWENIEKWIVPVAAARLTEWIPDSERQQLIKLIRSQRQ